MARSAPFAATSLAANAVQVNRPVTVGGDRVCAERVLAPWPSVASHPARRRYGHPRATAATLPSYLLPLAFCQGPIGA